jgi:phosphatidylglycerophosphate synthase
VQPEHDVTAQRPDSGKRVIQGALSTRLNRIYRNLPNIVSILGVLPLCILLLDDGFAYLCALIVFNNIMDDLDGILADKLQLRSQFGAGLDNVCDAVAHILIVMVVGAHHGGIVLPFSLLAATTILVRVVQRLAPSPASGTGTPTNELMRHLLLLSILQGLYGFDITAYLVVVLLLNSVSMLVPFAMPHLLRSRARSATAVVSVNVALVLAWGIPAAAPFVAAAFFGTYLYSFAVGGLGWLRSR